MKELFEAKTSIVREPKSYLRPVQSFYFLLYFPFLLPFWYTISHCFTDIVTKVLRRKYRLVLAQSFIAIVPAANTSKFKSLGHAIILVKLTKWSYKSLKFMSKQKWSVIETNIRRKGKDNQKELQYLLSLNRLVMFFSKQQNKKDRPKTRNNENGSLVSFLNNNISKGRNARRDQRFTSWIRKPLRRQTQVFAMVSVIWGREYIEAWDVIVGSKRTVGSSEVSRANRFDCYKVLIVSDKQVACVAGAFSGYHGYPHDKFQIIEELRRVKGGGGGEISPPLSCLYL